MFRRDLLGFRAGRAPAMLLLAWFAPRAFAEDPPAGGDPAATAAVTEPTPASPATPAPDPAAATAPTTAAPAVAKLARDPREVEAFKAAQERFTDRAKALESDTRSFIDQREKEEREKLSTAYDGAIGALDEDVRARRVLAIERFEQFLARYPDVAYASHVRFRLADLYWEDAKEDWLKRSEAYYKLEAELIEANRIDELPEIPFMDLSGPVTLYERIIADNRDLPPEQQYEYLDGTYYSLGFVYMEENAAQYDPDRARVQFLELIRVVPKSNLTDHAHLNLGNFEFAANRYPKAIAEYRFVYERGPTGPMYPEAVYQLAWAHYKTDVYEYPEAGSPPDATALALFTKLLDYSQDLVTNTGKKSDYAPDAIKFMAFSFADISENENGATPGSTTPVAVAQRWFAKVGPRDYEWDVYVALAKALTDYGRFTEAISVYKALQADPRWTNRPENPEFQMQVVKLWVSGPEADSAASAAARIELTEKYNDTTEWWHANRYNPEALGKARGYIESSLADVAIEYYLDANQTQDPAKFAEAAIKFREYLDKFPMSDDYYEMQWALAASYFVGQAYPEAIKEYESLAKSRAHHTYGDGSIVQLVQSRQQVMVNTHGEPGAVPPTAVVERTYTTQWKPEAPISVYTLSTEHVAFISATDVVLDWKFTPVTDPAATDFSKFVEDNYGALKYLPAQILYWHGRYDEARPRLLAVIQDPRTKCTQEADFAAKLLVDSYLTEGDNLQIRKYTKEFILHPPGCVVLEDPIFENALEGATFKIALDLAKTAETDADHVAAGEAFLDFMKEFPDSEFLNPALYNAANQYDIAGKAERSSELYQQYVDKYPKDEKSASLSFRIAANYESVFELSKAIDYYGRLIKNFPDAPVASDAAYNVAFLKVGIGDHAGAARGFQDYAAKYPDKEDAIETLWKAGEELELVGAAQAIAFYESFRREHGASDPNYLLQCDYKISEMYKKQGNTKKATEWLDIILKDWETLEQKGLTGQVKVDGRHYAAISAFRDVQVKFDILTKEKKLFNNEEKDAKLLQEKNDAVLAFRADVLSVVTRYADFEVSTQVLYIRAMASLYYVDLGFQLTCPGGYNEDECDAYRSILEDQVFPAFTLIQDAAKTELEGIVKLAQDKKLWSEWVDAAQIKLNELDPFTFPAQKKEQEGVIDSAIRTKIVPIEIDPNQKKVSATEEAP